MKFVISGGGTAGHIYPAIAVGQALLDMGHEVFFAGTPQGLEAKLVPLAGIPFTAFEVSGFDRAHPTTLLKSGVKALKSSSKAKKWLKEVGADAVVGFGGYVSIPVGKAAEDLHIPLVIHEQNSTCGMANKYLAPHATAVALTYEAAKGGLSCSCPVLLCGNPVRPEVLQARRDESRQLLQVPQDALLLLVFGGSLGSRHINQGMVALAPGLMEHFPQLHVVHVTGPKEYDSVVEGMQAAGVSVSGPDFDAQTGWSNPGQRYMLTGYFNHMGNALAASDVVIARAGATSLAEITALGAVSLLVPYPYATDDHQTKNAQALVQSGAALMVSDEEVETPEFADKLVTLLSNADMRQKMSQLTKQLGRVNAAKKVATLAVMAANGNIETGEIDAL